VARPSSGEIVTGVELLGIAAAGLFGLALLGLMFGLLRLDLAYRLFPSSSREASTPNPQQMV
jgi:hypothetical protein